MSVDDPAPASIASIAEGVFFDTPEPLPRGRHQLPRAEVLARQRGRLLIAATELLAHGGPAAVGVKPVCVRAGASLGAFYECFGTKEECIFAAYDQFISVFIDRLTGIDGNELAWEEYVEAVVAAYFDVLAQDLVVARAFQVEMDSLGAEARRRRRQALQGLGLLIRSKHAAWEGGDEGLLPESAYVAAVYGVRQLASDALDTPGSDLLATRDAVIGWVVRTFAGR